MSSAGCPSAGGVDSISRDLTEPARYLIDGFRFLRKWAGADDNDIKKIVAANIRKARLAKRFGDECREVGEILSWD